MTVRLAKQAGTAVAWKTAKLGGSKTISFIRLIILARLLAPDDFGQLAIAMITIQTMLIVTDFGMLPALIQCNDPKDIHYNTAWTVGIFRGLVVTIVGVMAAPWIAELFREPRATMIIRILALRPLIDAKASIS
jgi:O-antigen/teichoic acid export membrane protein